MGQPLHRMFEGAKRDALEADVQAYTAKVRTTATEPGDEVEVTLPYSDSPNLRLTVNWRVGVGVNGVGDLIPRYPEEDDEGFVIETEVGELWLIW